MDLVGLINSIITAMAGIDYGRKGFATKGKAEEGRISYEKGIALALTAFKEAKITADPQIIILAEYTFISQELQFCSETDKDTLSSLTLAIQNFDDAFLCLEAVEDTHGYKTADKTWPHSSKYRVKGYPKDALNHMVERWALKNPLHSDIV